MRKSLVPALFLSQPPAVSSWLRKCTNVGNEPLLARQVVFWARTCNTERYENSLMPLATSHFFSRRTTLHESNSASDTANRILVSMWAT